MVVRRCAGSPPLPVQRPLAPCAGSRPWPVGVRPRLPPSSSRRLSSLARQRPPSPAVSAPLRAVVVAPALVPCPSASALVCRRRRRAGFRPWPVGVRPHLPPSSSRRLSSLVPARRLPPSPAVNAPSRAVVLAPALVPCLSASALACRHRRHRRRHRRRRMRPTDHRRPAAARAFAVLVVISRN
jgi:hypothetical protein